MRTLLVTASLLNAWEWFLQDESENAVEVFAKVLRREPTPDNEAMRDGRAFETRVRLACNKDDDSWITEKEARDLSETNDLTKDYDYMNCVLELAESLRGAEWNASWSKTWIQPGHACVHAAIARSQSRQNATSSSKS